MAVDRHAVRADLTYLRRRPKRAAPEPPAPKPVAEPEPAPDPPSTPPAAPGVTLGLTPPRTPLAPSSGSTALTPPASEPHDRRPRAGHRGLTPPKPAADPPSPTPGGISLTRSAPASPADSPPASPGGSSLSLSRPASAEVGPAPERRAPERTLVPSDERVTDRSILARAHRTVTLTRRQSALGSFEFDVTGSGELCAVWELADGTSGVVDPHSGSHVSPEFGKRPVVELTGDRLLLGLRHSRQLRRVLIYLRFRGTEPARIIGSLYDGCTIESLHPPADPSDVCVALAIYNVDGELVLRRENVWVDTAEQVPTAYGFVATWLPPIRRA